MKPFIGLPVHYFELKKPNQPNAAIVIAVGAGDRVNLVVFANDARKLLGVNDVGYAVRLETDIPNGDAKPAAARTDAPPAWWREIAAPK